MQNRFLHSLELSVVCPAACRVDEPTSDTRDEQLVINRKLHDVVQLLVPGIQHVVELFGLRHRPREAVKHEPKLHEEMKCQQR